MTSTYVCRVSTVIGVVILTGYALIVTSSPSDAIKRRPRAHEVNNALPIDSRDDSGNNLLFTNVKVNSQRQLKLANNENSGQLPADPGNPVKHFDEKEVNRKGGDEGRIEEEHHKPVPVDPVEIPFADSKKGGVDEDLKMSDNQKPKVEKGSEKESPKRSLNRNNRQKNIKKPDAQVNEKNVRPVKPHKPKKKRRTIRRRKKKPRQPKKLVRKTPYRRRSKVVPEQMLSEEDSMIYHNKLIKSFGQNYKSSKEYKTIVDRCSEYPQHKGRILFYDTSPYIETQPHLCDGTPDILIAVHTRPTHHERRQLIRDTFGSMRNVHGKRIVIAFFLGSSQKPKVDKRIREESKNYRDVIYRDFKEHYRNMTYKHLTIMDWIMEFCPKVKYLVKVDDDVFVNLFQVVDYLDTFNLNGFYCTRTVGPKPMRKGGKWKVTYEEYPKRTFPPYCMGYAYVMKASLAKSLFWCSVYSKFLWIDDVHVGGTLPQRLRLNLVRFISGHNAAYILPSHASWKVADYMFLLGTKNELLPSDIRKIWRASLRYSY